MVIDGKPYKTDSNGNPKVFELERNENGTWLNSNWANPDNRWNPENRIVFSLRESNLFRVFRRSRKLRLLGAVFLIWIVHTLFPTPKHLSYLIQFKGNISIVFMRN